MQLEFILFIGSTLFLGSVLQGAVGFAYGLFAIPVLVWLGVPLNETVALMSVSTLIQVLIGAYQLRADIQWAEVLPATLIRVSTIPLGIGLLIILSTLESHQIKQFLGLFLLAVLLLQMLWRVEPRDQIHPAWRWLAFSGSGIMHGMVAMGGPPVVLWVMAHRWTNRQSRAFLFALFSLAVPVQLALLYLSFGQKIIPPMLTGLAFAPLVAAGSALGVRLGNLMTTALLRQVAFSLLFFIAFASIITP
ncbi:MAG TPA: TSUP family transporter [Anaerolineae bacterium]|nr:TSUP family transporter [Anaerolineae bacterium]HMR66457.1 TSUP family transporter [Anaerolineae bacterium]